MKCCIEISCIGPRGSLEPIERSARPPIVAPAIRARCHDEPSPLLLLPPRPGFEDEEEDDEEEDEEEAFVLLPPPLLLLLLGLPFSALGGRFRGKKESKALDGF